MMSRVPWCRSDPMKCMRPCNVAKTGVRETPFSRKQVVRRYSDPPKQGPPPAAEELKWNLLDESRRLAVQGLNDIKLCATTLNEVTQLNSNLSNQLQRFVLFSAVFGIAWQNLKSLWGYLKKKPQEISLNDVLFEIKETRAQLKNLETEQKTDVNEVKDRLVEIEASLQALANKKAPEQKPPTMEFIRRLGNAPKPDYIRFK